MDKHTYAYNGPVYLFDRIVDRNYIAVTTAVSKAKAKSNLEYKYKMSHGYSSNSMIKISEKELKEVL